MRVVVMLILLLLPAGARAAAPETIGIPGGSYLAGDPEGRANEVRRTVAVGTFRIMKYEVTNRQFAAFVAATGYRTDIERNREGYVWTERWRRVDGADWRHPHGPQSAIDGLDDHPVVQVSARDAAAFCRFHGLRLPREEEWAFAARGPNWRRYPWGDQTPRQAGARRTNFGRMTCCAADDSDGYRYTAPVGRFPSGASPFGVQDMAGNVWEWTSSPMEGRPGRNVIRGGGWGNRPFCLRLSYRHWNPVEIGLDMVGIRCAGDAT